MGFLDALLAGNDIYLNVAAVPEPSTYALCAGLGVSGVAVWRRRAAGNQRT